MFYLFLYFSFPSQGLAPRRHSVNNFGRINEGVSVLNKGIDNIKIILETPLIMLESILHISYNRKPFLIVQAFIFLLKQNKACLYFNN